MELTQKQPLQFTAVVAAATSASAAAAGFFSLVDVIRERYRTTNN